ncbi:hypothetical protein Clacol_002585 [Clathrus columnatus]|uniref:THUMP domain-containing protein n=1 Tax=Clathrus columnatus TaxID=1419009 RepID=A0AAV5A144_9AGAM|nr:hypothetical protein Clacol_002585 [Clathrus columnatus]
MVQLEDELWPIEGTTDTNNLENLSDNLECQFQKEIRDLKKPRIQSRFVNVQTGTPCVVFISCKPPVDPVRLLMYHLENVERTGVTRTKHVLRLIPVSWSCVASIAEIVVLARKYIPSTFNTLPMKSDGSKSYRYKLDVTFRNHDKIKKAELIPLLAACVPPEHGHKVDLEHPEVFRGHHVNEAHQKLLNQSVCGMSVVQHYERFKRFNVVQIGEAARRVIDN